MIEVDYDGNERRGLTARCRREDGSDEGVDGRLLAHVFGGVAELDHEALDVERENPRPHPGAGQEVHHTLAEQPPRRPLRLGEKEVKDYYGTGILIWAFASALIFKLDILTVVGLSGLAATLLYMEDTEASPL